MDKMKFILSGAFKSGSRKMPISRTTLCGFQALALSCAVLVCGISTTVAVRAGVLDSRGNASDPRELRLVACQKYIEGDYDEARNYYQQAIATAEKTYGEKSSFVADLYYEAGSLSLEDGNFPKADKLLGIAVKRKPNSIMARVKYAELLAMQGQTQNALDQIQEALKRNPGAPEAQQALVKWMMTKASQCGTKTPDGARASLASTMEGYKLSNMGRSANENAHNRIARWGKRLPPVQIETSVAATSQQPTSALDLLKKVIEPAKTEAEKPAESQKQEAKQPEPPKPKKVVAAKPKPPKPKAKPKPQEQPKTKPRREKPSESVVAGAPPPPPMSIGVTSGGGGKSKKGNGVLVPPPPPFNPVFTSSPPPPSSNFSIGLKTDATIKQPEVRKSKPKPQVVDEEPKELLEWAGVEDKKKKPKSIP